MKTIKSVVATLVLASAFNGTARAEGPRRLTLKEAIDLTLQMSPELAIATETVGSAEARRSRSRARLLPSLSVSGSGNLYAKPYELPFGTQTFTLHELVTSVETVRVSQPLSGLAYLSELVGAAEHEQKAARADYDRTRLDVSYATADAYIRVLEARAAADVSHRSVAEIASELERSEKLRKADTLTNVDVLRLQSAKAAADQGAVRTETTSQISIAQLGVTIGLHDGELVEIVDDLPVTPPPLAMTLAQAQDRAMAARPELRAAREHTAAATDLVTSSREEYLPDLRAVADYTHTTGVQPFQPANTEFLGLTLSWNVWDWGATHSGVQEAEHTQTRARLTASALADHVRLDVRRRWLEAKASFDNLASAQTQLQTAEEAFRLQHVKFEAAAATTTDVLDAETDVARARLQSSLARYDYYLGLISLARAVGDLPTVGH